LFQILSFFFFLLTISFAPVRYPPFIIDHFHSLLKTQKGLYNLHTLVCR
jgi:hypothetical protein